MDDRFETWLRDEYRPDMQEIKGNFKEHATEQKDHGIKLATHSAWFKLVGVVCGVLLVGFAGLIFDAFKGNKELPRHNQEVAILSSTQINKEQ